MDGAQAQLDGFIDKFTPEMAALTRALFARMKARLPGAAILVYDNYNALAIGFAPTERASDVIFSIAVYPKWVSLFMFGGQKLKDPKKLLKGSGNTVRHIVLKDGAATLDDPGVKTLVDQCLKLADPPLDPAQKYRLIIKSISAKQRPRRP